MIQASLTKDKGEHTLLLELKPSKKKSFTSKNTVYAIGILGLCTIAFVCGFYSSNSTKYRFHKGEDNSNDASPKDYHETILSYIEPENIRENLRYLTRRQHIAGSADSYKEVKYLKKFYEDAGFDRVDIAEYDILLSYPKEPAYLSIANTKSKKMLFETRSKERRLWKDEFVPNVVYPFNSYSPPGSVKGKLVYVNYGRPQDFELLVKLKINVAGCIVIVRYGMGYRGNKVENAQNAGAIGVILYTDPMDYSRSDVKYPNSWWLPEYGVQSGDIQSRGGDPLTPGYPSVDGIYRIPLKKALLPKIPVQPISYGDALPLLRQMDGVEAPKEWQGGLNITYRINMNKKNPNEVQLTTYTQYQRGKIHDVIATIKGETEPDRVVLLGNHHDAIVMGASDPSSGTSMMMEIGRSLGKAKKNGWRPRRSIKICAWDAEEFGMTGSTEWVEENTHVLLYEAVAYLNVDIAVKGRYTVFGRSSAQLPDVLFNAAKQVADPEEKGKTLFETWSRKRPDRNNKGYPRLAFPGASSDHKTFFSRLGIPVVDLTYHFDESKYKGISSYPTYHSIHDTFHYMETFVDHNFTYHMTLAKLLTQTALSLSDEVIIPFNYSTYARVLQICYKTSRDYEKPLANHNISMAPLKDAIDKFTEAAVLFHDHVKNMEKHSLLKVRMINDRIMHIGRTFIAPEGLQGQPFEKHVIYAPSAHNSYKGACFPGLYDTMFDLLEGFTTDWTVAAQELSMVVYYIREATTLLEFK